MLLGNYSVLHKSPGRYLSGSTVSDAPGNFGKSGPSRNRFYGCEDNGFRERCSVPDGYRPPYCWIIAQKDGGLGSFQQISGSGAVAAANLAGGLNADAALIGLGGVANADLALIVSAVALLTGTGTITSAAIAGKLEAAATLAGAGSVSGALGALASAVAAILASGATTAGIAATGEVAASITPFTALSPESLAANVWNSVADSFAATGTMGQKMARLEELYALAGLDPTKPLVVTSTARTAGAAVTQTIAEAPVGTVTVTRT